MPATPIHHTATTDSSWDGPAAVAAMPNDDAVLRYCHAWQTAEAANADHKSGDDDADDQKSSYKFPHHATKGGPANLAACRNGLARLSSANIPDGDRAGVEAHLRAHMEDAEGSSDNLVAQIGMLSNQDRVHRNLIRAKRLSDKTEWYALSDGKAGGPASLNIYDEIGFFGVSAGDFKAALNAVTSDTLNVSISSPGGDVFDGMAILNMLRAHPAEVHVTVEGLAASAASFIAMAGDTVTMMPNSMLMIHDAWGVCCGNEADMVETSALLGTLSDNIASVYAARAGGDAASWRAVMRGEQWYSAEEAVAAGLADSVASVGEKSSTGKQPAAHNSVWNMSLYAYSDRQSAPAPKTPVASAPPVVQFDPELFRAAFLKGAAK